ncbi:hypothetical protein FN846DRAFT_894204 [Sphaerosporella brunnea]|uniref:Uncharacterized protein n=1 Tax=Sphaerosporella brunnea TaxID=1250544 RepID=A0A5J5EJZ5_9PEZI|nr:hypothetical protein FN846DRAFT_894204 [Sphaerosporella brunnea]
MKNTTSAPSPQPFPSAAVTQLLASLRAAGRLPPDAVQEESPEVLAAGEALMQLYRETHPEENTACASTPSFPESKGYYTADEAGVAMLLNAAARSHSDEAPSHHLPARTPLAQPTQTAIRIYDHVKRHVSTQMADYHRQQARRL